MTTSADLDRRLMVQLADSITDAHSLEQLVRPLLALLESATGLESTYMTAIDEAAGLQHVLYARNSRSLNIPEGLSVPWGDTLCKRALDEVEALCAAEGLTCVRLEVSDGNDHAREIYRRRGYTPHSRRLMTKWLG